MKYSPSLAKLSSFVHELRRFINIKRTICAPCAICNNVQGCLLSQYQHQLKSNQSSTYNYIVTLHCFGREFHYDTHYFTNHAIYMYFCYLQNYTGKHEIHALVI